MMFCDIDYYVLQKQYSCDCDVRHNRHLELKIRVLTVYNKEPRNSAFEDLDAYDVQFFGHGVKFISAGDYDVEDPAEVKKSVWYVLHNSDETVEYRRYVFTY